ncbi:MAG TPA: S8 family serine peptidase [Puia sp.]|nr:S8 family serine peptidase [Puia sp.]
MYKLIAILLLASSFSYAQSGAEHPAKRPQDWWQADWKKDSIPGISLDEAYNYLKGRKSKTVIVAIIDNCVDTSHEDLKDFIWTNKKEIAGNGIDDDGNGYADDVHGWCFIANKNNIAQTKQSALEVLVYEAWKKHFENIDSTKLKSDDKVQYDIYQTAKKMMLEKYKFFQAITILQSDSSKLIQYVDKLLPEYKDNKIKEIPFSTLSSSSLYDSAANLFLRTFVKTIPTTITLSRFYSRLQISPGFNGLINFINQYTYRDTYDTTNDYRKTIGDNPDDFNDKNYGTPSINLPEIVGEHATFIAGIICGNRNNGIGIRGIADNVQIMPLVTSVQGGGSISKDIVMAIHYAVDNGASVINMSFGITPWIDEHEKELRTAFDYAYKHNVLIVNAAGNDGLCLDKEKYLMGMGSNGKEHDSYIRVGATTTLMNDSLVSSFSQFGGKTVDLFAPGTAIYSTVPGNKYESSSGTSAACPVVVGVAALLKSYFPSLTAKQIKEIIVKSVYKPDVMVIPPASSGIKNKIPFSKMSKSGGIVNAYNAVKLADEMTK